MLGRAGTKKIFFTENLKRGLYKKGPLTQYLRRGWHKQIFSIKNVRWGWYKKPPLSQYVRRGCHEKPPLSQYVRGWVGGGGGEGADTQKRSFYCKS